MTLTNGNAVKGGAIYNSGTLNLIETTFSNNTATSTGRSFGGAIYNIGTLNLTDSKFTSNTAGTTGGAIYNYENTGITTITNGSFTDNTAYSGGAIDNENILTATGTTFTGNDATGGSACYGGAIYSYCDTTLTDCTFTGNTATYDGGAITNYSGTLKINSGYFSSNTATKGGGAIYNLGNVSVTGTTFAANTAQTGGAVSSSGGTLTVENSNFMANNAESTNYGGGAIYNNSSTVIISDSTFSNNTATGNTGTTGRGGGAICNLSGTLTITNTTLTSNTATYYGGAIYSNASSCTCTVTNCTISNNNASDGGAIYNAVGWFYVMGSTLTNNTATNGGAINNYGGSLKVTNSTLTNNTATTYGGAVYNGATSIIQFNRLIRNSNYDIYNNSGTLNALYNWWGTNFLGTDPQTEGRINDSTSSWMVLGINADPVSVSSGSTSTVTANLLYDSLGICHSSEEGVVPYGDLVDFVAALGTIADVNMVDGVATSTFTAGKTSGTADLSTTIDDQTVATSVTIFNGPEVSSIDPISGVVINSNTKAITVTFNKSVVQGSGTIELKNSSGSSVAFTTSFGSNYVTITPSSALVDGTYTVVLNTGCVTDADGNELAAYSSSFTVDTVAPLLSKIDPTNGGLTNNASKVITVTFSEAVKSGMGSVTLKNSSGTSVSVKTVISGKTLTITPSSALTNGNYAVSIPAGSVVDSAGNKLAVFTSKFTVDTVKPMVASSSPVSGATNVAVSKTIIVTFSEAIKKGNSFVVKLLNSSGTAIAYTYSISGKVLTIDPKINLAESKYKLVLYGGCVTDLAGNSFAGKTISFSVGISPTVSSSSPANGATKVARNKILTVTFNEAILAGSNYNKITLKASNGTTVIIRKSISGKVLTITHSARLAAKTKYTLTIYSGSVTDKAGNPVAAKTITFTTGST